MKLAKYMDEVRAYLGDRAITVTSGYRDPASNQRVKGARNSRPMVGDAVDFYVEEMSVVDTFYKFKSYHTTGRSGGGLEAVWRLATGLFT